MDFLTQLQQQKHVTLVYIYMCDYTLFKRKNVSKLVLEFYIIEDYTYSCGDITMTMTRYFPHDALITRPCPMYIIYLIVYYLCWKRYEDEVVIEIEDRLDSLLLMWCGYVCEIHNRKNLHISLISGIQ